MEKALAEATSGDVTLTAAEVREQLAAQNITPLKNESPEDAIKAASAEVIEALTVGAAETAGAEAGEEAGVKVAGEVAATAVQVNSVAKAKELVGTMGTGPKEGMMLIILTLRRG